MRNLRLALSSHARPHRALAAAHCVSVNTDTAVVFVGSARGLAGLDPHSGEVVVDVSLVDEGYLAGDGSGRVVGIQTLPDADATCVATSQGDVLLYSVTRAQLECVGSVDSGLTAMSWSPDQDVMVLTTGADTIIAMTRDFDPLTEVPMHQDDFGEAKFVTVGWGRKETQFHGSEGKQAAHKKQEVVAPAFTWDDGRPRVSWRGDGQFFAVSSVCLHTGARRVRVWSRECVLQATSEILAGLEPALAWKPSGSLIASSQRKPGRHDVVFLERNGLAHGEFTLPFGRDDMQVRELLWNADSTILAVWLEELAKETETPAGEKRSFVQLWMVGNYHWYLKQSLQLGGGDGGGEGGEPLAALCWDPECPQRLHCVMAGGAYVVREWWPGSDAGRCLDEGAGSSVAVIDGDRVLLTPFRLMTVPPPMAAFHLQLPLAAERASFCPESGRADDVAVLLCDRRRVLVYTHGGGGGGGGGTAPDPTVRLGLACGNGFRTRVGLPSLVRTYRIREGDRAEGGETGGSSPSMRGFREFTWLGRDRFLAVSQGSSLCCSVVMLLRGAPREEGSEEPAEEPLTAAGSALELHGRVLSVTLVPGTDSALLQLSNGELLRCCLAVEPLSVEAWTDERGRPVSFPAPCVHVEVCTMAGQEVALGLTERARLFANDIEVASNCTSFCVHPELLLFTTRLHTLRCVSRLAPVAALAGLPSGGDLPGDETVRRVERGSRIVALVPSDCRLVLQMPRGNLETIQPRALLLSQVRKWLDSLKFKEAFECMKKQRINLNLLYDHNPKAFMDNIGEFLTQAQSAGNVNLFLTELRDEDVARTMYPVPYGWAQPPATAATAATEPFVARSTGKVNAVCDGLRAAMEALDPDRFFLSILTALVRRKEPDVETALMRVRDVAERAAEGAGDGGAEEAERRAQEALGYLLLLVDEGELYECALGTYDFRLVLMVAQRSQKDPKEYLPFLNELKKMETNYQRYSIDNHLKRYGKALVHLSRCGPDRFPELLSLVRSRALYREALRLFPCGGEEYTALSEAFGRHLLEERRQGAEAGLVFARAALWQAALPAFRDAGCWRQALCAATRLGYPALELTRLARDMAEKLAAQRKHVEAACLLEQYAEDHEEAVVTLTEGGAWEEAMRLIHKHNRLDLLETNLKPAVKEADGGNDEGAECDLYSDASSVASSGVLGSKYSQSNSRISGRSSKNRRKAARKRLSLREGSPSEEPALLDAIGDIARAVDARTAEVGPLLRMLLLFDWEAEGQELQAELSSLLLRVERALPEVWPPTATSAAPVFGPDSTVNSIAASLSQPKETSWSPGQEDEFLTAPRLSKSTEWKLCSLDPASI
ncbi:elongator complex protein 1 isoform X2 [Petromyzon marinus]|uniref:elongator complex protein 1 isoform X2 n=1 Tax=Petromyzon marinus TaxID=7757 RepID=UPI003F700BFD